MQVRNRRNRRSRSQRDPSKQPNVTNAVATVSVNANKMRMDFNTPVLLVAAPNEASTDGPAITVNGAQCTAAVQNSPTQIDLTFAVNVAAAQDWVIPDLCPGIRTPSGGHVAAATGTF